ncbi:extracellular solute-binding protein [Stratiformator vulcanicus]|nr:extracellular solute-binding protein [Stratiformator vulcanicus]
MWAMSGEAGLPAGRERVVFWHFWGGAEREAVRDVVARFNASQDEYEVEEVPVPGQNLDMKFFMAVAGGSYPDLINQDDQVIAQWASRGVLTPMRELCEDEAEYERLMRWLSPPAKRIGTYEGELFALCNALDIRAMFYRSDFLADRPVPQTIEEFDALAMNRIADPNRISYLPDDRRLWAWGTAFGGDFVDPISGETSIDDPEVVTALEWMRSYADFHGRDTAVAFRSTARETGAGSMLLDGRYAIVMDGQWRVAELDAAAEQAIAAGQMPIRYEVGPLPYPPGGRPRAGWVNGNFFLVPRGARNPDGAWAFMKFWAGFDNESEAADTAATGGWIPASRKVIEQPTFQAYLDEHPKFRLFVELTQSEAQIPTPAVSVQTFLYERVNRAADEAISGGAAPAEALRRADVAVEARLKAGGGL